MKNEPPVIRSPVIYGELCSDKGFPLARAGGMQGRGGFGEGSGGEEHKLAGRLETDAEGAHANLQNASSPGPKRDTFTRGLGQSEGESLPPSAVTLTQVPPTSFRGSLSPPDPEYNRVGPSWMKRRSAERGLAFALL